MPKKIMIIAGEASGDFHSSSLIHALKKINPGIEISGMGGQRMREAGARLLFDTSELSIIGFTGVLANLRKIKKVFNGLLEAIDERPPDAIVLVDYPGFNLKLAREIKKRKIPVIYYISPQVWAWWKGRIKTIGRFVDKMIVVFKFEEALYRDSGVDASFVGHPLLDIAHPAVSREDFLNKSGLSPQRQTIGLVPGSRKMEVERILPILLESARLIKEKSPDTQFALLKAPGLPGELFTNAIARSNSSLSLRGAQRRSNPLLRLLRPFGARNDGDVSLPLTLCENQTYDFLNACDFALVASGTATLETAIMQKPMLLVYKVSFLNWLIARALIKLPFIGLVNVVAGKKIVPEFVQYKAKPRLIAEKALEILGSRERLREVKADLEKVRQGLGAPGASRRAAEIVSRFIG